MTNKDVPLKINAKTYLSIIDTPKRVNTYFSRKISQNCVFVLCLSFHLGLKRPEIGVGIKSKNIKDGSSFKQTPKKKELSNYTDAFKNLHPINRKELRK